MTREEGNKLLKPFIEKCEKDADPYFVVHFSRVDDYFGGFDNGLDFIDATIIAKQLVKQFPQLKIYFYE